MASKGKYKEWIEPEGLTKIEGWARMGLTEKQIANNMGISEQTLNVWKKRFPSLLEALKKGKEVVDFEVENALLKRAKGYHTVETVSEIYGDGRKHIRKIEKDIPPDTTAAIFWLKNRRPDLWRNNPVLAETEEFEDDGLLDALNNSSAELFVDGDDSDMVQQEEE